MKRRHIAVFTNLGNGHVYSALELCSELVKRGYRITYATNEHYAPVIKQAGAKPVIFKPAVLHNSEIFEKKVFDTLPIDDPRWWALHASLIYPYFLLDAAVRLPQLEEVYQNDPPDIILYDRLEFAARILAKRLSCPTILLYSHFAFYKKFIHRESGVCINPEPMLIFSQLLDSFLAAHGIEQKDNLWHAEELNIYFIPKQFQHHPESFDQRFLFVGSCLNRPFHPSWTDDSNGRPIVLVSDTSGINDVGYFKTIAAALSSSDYHVILSIGDSFPVDSLGALPVNFKINQRASHLEILPRVALSISQAGMNTTLESLYHGVPVIALPPTPSHAEIAYRTAELGLGIHLTRRSMTPEVVREAVDRALGDTILRQRVTQMQRAFKDSGGAAMAADRIESFMGVRHLL